MRINFTVNCCLRSGLAGTGRAAVGESFYAVGADKPEAFFGFTQDRRHHPNGTRIAFWAESRAEVDRLARLVRKIGGKNLEGPQLCHGYSRGYYACFFEDPDGNKLEICCRENPIVNG